jgi:hypothetical protein
MLALNGIFVAAIVFFAAIVNVEDCHGTGEGSDERKGF